MSLVVNTNVASLNAQRILNLNTASLQKNMERLASGYRINRASDDAAGLQISEKLRSQIRGIGQAITNAQDGTNMLAIAEGTLSVVQEHLQRIRELTVQAANDTNGTSQRNSLKQEIEARMDDINRITKATEFNGRKLLDGTSSSLRLQIGANAVQSLDTIDIATSTLGSATASGLGVVYSTNMIASNGAARLFLTSVDNALTKIGQRLAKIGASQNRLDSAISNLNISKENFESAESRIRNVDVAKEASVLTRNQILQQASASILSQANQAPQLALRLLQQ